MNTCRDWASYPMATQARTDAGISNLHVGDEVILL